MQFKNSFYPWLAKPGGELVDKKYEGKKKNRIKEVFYKRPPREKLGLSMPNSEKLKLVEDYINKYLK